MAVHRMYRLKSRLQDGLTNGELVVSVLLFLLVVGLAAYASTWPRKPALMPLGVCIIVALLLLREITVVLRRRGTRAEKPIPGTVIAGFAAFALMIPVAWIAGLVPATGLLGACLCSIYGERRWWAAGATGVVCSLLTYAIFGYVFNVPLTF